MATKRLVTKLERLLAPELTGFESGLFPPYKGGLVTGFIVSGRFKGKDFPERQRILKRLLERFVADQALSPKELLEIGPIVAMTPEEADVGEAAAAEISSSARRPRRKAS